MQVYNLISSISSDFYIFTPLVTGPVHQCVISTLRRVAISTHWTYHARCHLCPTRYSFPPESSEAFEGKCLAWGYNIEPMTQYWEGRNMISLKILHHGGFNTARQAATLTKLRTLTIVPRPSVENCYRNMNQMKIWHFLSNTFHARLEVVKTYTFLVD